MTVTRPNKRQKGEGTAYQRKSDGMWCFSFELPSHDGTRRRKVLTAKTEGAVKQKAKDAKRELLKHGDLPTGSQTLAVWLNYWFEHIAVKQIRPKTAGTYRVMIDKHIIPAIGRTRLDKLTIAHVSKLADAITSKGLSTTTALQAHRVLAVALKYAEREGRVLKNVAALSDAPRRAVPNLTALSATEGVKALAEAARERSDGVLADRFGLLYWAVLLTGARQGELLGLQIDRVSETLDFSWQLQRLPWQHGCDGRCDRDRLPARGKPRGTDCPQRRLVAPADWEHKRLQGGLYLARPKSRAGWRAIPLVEPLRTVIERQIALTSQEPNPHNLVWTMPNGAPIDPRVASESWHAFLNRAEVSDVRFHDGRHTTVELLLDAGVPVEIVMAIVGHSSRAMTLDYRTRGNRVGMHDAMVALSSRLSVAGKV